MAGNLLGRASISVTDINDAIISSTKPRKPVDDMLWIDDSGEAPILKVYRNGKWHKQELDVRNLDPDLSETIQTVLDTLGTLADDGVLSFTDRQRISQEIGNIIGEMPSLSTGNRYPNTLPDYTVLDSRGVGSFASTRQTARDATVSTDDPDYLGLRTAYDALNSYFSGLTPKPWDITLVNKSKETKVTDPDRFREVLLDYYLAELRLSTTSEKRAQEAQKEYTDIAVSDAIVSVDIEFVSTSDPKNPPPNDASWNTNPPEWKEGMYMWQRTITTYKNQQTHITPPVNISGTAGEDGVDGRSISEIKEWYYLSDSPTSLTGGRWVEGSAPPWEDGKFMWTKTETIFVNPSGRHESEPVSITGSKGEKGDKGDDAPLVKLSGGTQLIKVSETGVTTPSSSFTISGVGVNTNITTWSYSVDGGNFTTSLTGIKGVSRSGSTVTISPGDSNFTTLSIRASDGVVADTFTVGRAIDGKDAITVILTNESHTFRGDVSSAVAGSTTTDILAYVGTRRVPVTIGDITGMPRDMTWSISNNHTQNARVTFSVGINMSSSSGTVEIPLTIDGQSITKTFSYALALKGDKGDPGVSIKGVDVEYAQNTSSTSAPTTGWSTDAPDWRNGRYIWSRTKTTYSSGDPTYSKPVCITGQKGSDGTHGQGISSIVEQYYLSDSKETRTGGSWETTAPKWEQGKYMWTRSQINWTNPTDRTYTDPIVDTAWEAMAEATKGIGLDDKTETLSGTEVFTDKADDSVVHVEIDGKSVGGGTGKNLLVGAESFDWGTYADGYSDVTVNNMGEYVIRAERDEIAGPLGVYPSRNTLRMKLEKGKRYTLSFDVRGNFEELNYIHIVNIGSHDQPLPSISIPGTNNFNRVSVEFIGVNYVSEYSSIMIATALLSGDWFEVKNIQIEEGSTATEYEPPAPTPDYPIEIHSLNDFDVVSSVGKRNLLSNSKFGRYIGGRLTNYDERNYRLLNDVYYIYENPGSSLIGFEIPNPKGNITFSGLTSYSSLMVFYRGYNKNGVTTVSQQSFGISVNNGEFRSVESLKSHPDTDYYNLGIGVVGNRGNNGWIKPKIEMGDTATPYSPAPEDITENDNYPLIDKINLLLSEPLRSVGDVKDRLFRDDSDGLWKVERNVGELVADGSEDWKISVPRWQGANDTMTFHITLGKGYPWGKFPREELTSNLFMTFDNRYKGLDVSDHDFELVTSDNTVGDKRFKVLKSRLKTQDLNGWKDFLAEKELEGTPLKLLYVVKNPSIETLNQEFQDKLNNLRSFQNSNYIYTVINDKTDTISENLKPTLHATFKGGGWYSRWKIGDVEESAERNLEEGLNLISKDIMADWVVKADSIVGYVDGTYVSTDGLNELRKELSTNYKQTDDEFLFQFNRTTDLVSEVEGELAKYANEVEKHIRFKDGDIILGEVGSESVLKITNKRISFIQGDTEVAYIVGQEMKINHGIFVDSATIAGFKFSLVEGTEDVMGVTWVE